MGRKRGGLGDDPVGLLLGFDTIGEELLRPRRLPLAPPRPTDRSPWPACRQAWPPAPPAATGRQGLRSRSRAAGCPFRHGPPRAPAAWLSGRRYWEKVWPCGRPLSYRRGCWRPSFRPCPSPPASRRPRPACSGSSARQTRPPRQRGPPPPSNASACPSSSLLCRQRICQQPFTANLTALGQYSQPCRTLPPGKCGGYPLPQEG